MTRIYKCLRNEISTHQGYTIKLVEDLLENEQFVDHPVLEVQVSNLGRFKTISGTVTKGWMTEAGYLRVTVKGKAYFAHRLVLETFNPIINSKELQVDHIDRNRENNILENLRWTTPQENNQNKQKHTPYKHRCPMCRCYE